MNDDNFFSMNRLVEFGLGLGIAQQMAKSMNEAIQNMHTPGIVNQSLKPTPAVIYFVLDDKQVGPFTESEVSKMIAANKISSETFVWMPSMPQWKPASEVPEILKLVALSPPPFKPTV